MAHRSLIFAFLALCLFYVIQASPMPQDGAQAAPGTDTLAQMQAAANRGLAAAQDGFNAMINDPIVKKATEDAKRMFEASIQAASDGLKQLVPKTE